mgnify:CR=1 FL=1
MWGRATEDERHGVVAAFASASDIRSVAVRTVLGGKRHPAKVEVDGNVERELSAMQRSSTIVCGRRSAATRAPPNCRIRQRGARKLDAAARQDLGHQRSGLDNSEYCSPLACRLPPTARGRSSIDPS